MLRDAAAATLGYVVFRPLEFLANAAENNETPEPILEERIKKPYTVVLQHPSEPYIFVSYSERLETIEDLRIMSPMERETFHGVLKNGNALTSIRSQKHIDFYLADLELGGRIRIADSESRGLRDEKYDRAVLSPGGSLFAIITYKHEKDEVRAKKP